MTLANVKERFFEELRDGYSSEEINLAFKALSDSYHQQKFSISENDMLRDQHLEYFDSALQRLRKNEPVEYILGEARFFGRGFKVNSEVHVPRPESETMVEWVLEDLEKLTKPGTKSSGHRFGLRGFGHHSGKGNSRNFGDRHGYFERRLSSCPGKCISVGSGHRLFELRSI